MTKIEANDLFDLYGRLLTRRQREILSLSIQEDLSFGEIAAELGISRAAAADAVKRGESLLMHYEKAVGMLGVRQQLLKYAEKDPVWTDRIEQAFAAEQTPDS